MNDDAHPADEDWSLIEVMAWIIKRDERYQNEIRSSSPDKAAETAARLMASTSDDDDFFTSPMDWKVAETELRAALRKGRLKAVGYDNSGNRTEIGWKGRALVLFENSDLSGVLSLFDEVMYSRVSVSAKMVRDEWPSRDRMAGRLFKRSVWDSSQLLHWVECRTSEGYYDVQECPQRLAAIEMVDDKLRTGKLRACIHENWMSREFWFENSIAERAAKFERADVLKAFEPRPVNETTLEDINRYLSELPEVSERKAVEKVSERFPKALDTMIKKAVKEQLQQDGHSRRFPPARRGRPRKETKRPENPTPPIKI